MICGYYPGPKATVPLILVPLAVAAAFLYAPNEAVMGAAGKFIYFHVPCAWIGILAYMVSAFYAVQYLRHEDEHIETRFNNSAIIGTVFTVCATISGSVWARIAWGSFWNWDPREVTITVLLLVYAAYFALRLSSPQKRMRAKLSAVYLLFAAATVPFFAVIIPRFYQTLHPQKMQLVTPMRITLILSIIACTSLYQYVFFTYEPFVRLF